MKLFFFLPAAMIEHAPLQSVYIYFDTATYDEIERDVKVTYNILTVALGEKMV